MISRLLYSKISLQAKNAKLSTPSCLTRTMSQNLRATEYETQNRCSHGSPVTLSGINNNIKGINGFSLVSRRGFSQVTADKTTTRSEPQVAENLTQIGIRSIFEHEHDMYRELCRKFYIDEVMPYHAQWEEGQ